MSQLYLLFGVCCVCRCSPGWSGHRCESMASSSDGSGSSGRKSLSLALTSATITVEVEFHVMWPTQADFIFVHLCERRHSLHCDHGVDSVAAGSPGRRSTIVVQEKNEGVSSSLTLRRPKYNTVETPFLHSLFPPPTFFPFSPFHRHFYSPLCNGISFAPQV